MDRLQSMAVFVRVAEQGSFSRAARQLGLSKSAVSKHVTRARGAAGRAPAQPDHAAAGADRGGRGLPRLLRAGGRRRPRRPTSPPASHSLDAARPAQGQRAHDLRLPAPGPAAAGVPGRHPAIEVELSLDDRVVDLLEEGFDLAVRIGRLADSSLIARRLADRPASSAPPAPAYLARAGTPAGPADLARHNCLRYSYRRQPDDWSFGRGGERVTVRVARQPAGQQRRRAARCRPRRAGHRLPARLHRRRRSRERRPGPAAGRLGERREIPIHAVFPPQRHPSAKLRAFVDFLVERFGRRDRLGAAAAVAAAPRSWSGLMFKDDLLAGAHILITGGGTGLGKSMGRRFLELGARLSDLRPPPRGARGHRRRASRRHRRRGRGPSPATSATRTRSSGWSPRPRPRRRSPPWSTTPPATSWPAARSCRRARSTPWSASCSRARSTAPWRWAGAGWPQGRRGTVLSIVTSYAWTGSAYVLPSAVAKAGVLAMTRSLAVEWGGRGVRLNADRARAVPDRGRLGAAGAAARAGARLRDPQPAGPRRRASRAGRPRHLSAGGRQRLYQRRGRRHRRRRVAARAPASSASSWRCWTRRTGRRCGRARASWSADRLAGERWPSGSRLHRRRMATAHGP